MPATDLSLLVDAAQRAGQIATQFTGPEAKRWDKPDGAGPVTEADLAVNSMLEDMLPSARADYGWLSEESEDSDTRLSCDSVFIIDPIDGTRSFAEGGQTWAHSLAVADKGEVTAAVIYLPQRELLYCAARGMGATCNGTPIYVADLADLDQANVLAARPNLDGRHWRTGTAPMFKRSLRPSLAYRMAQVADGHFDAMLTLRPSWEWDIAAGDLILREAGGICSDRTGKPLKFNNPQPLLSGVVAANHALHEAMISALDPTSSGISAR
ncbi:inositol monophosphatase family protein [Parasedimentitalea huanghaiensis]|uniref:3'(2'),5'-bisphosphate nucleotidase CysQ n=1 Tax=Parasedimentitalea huanghaiensis TaxID=2682100 RepID=A0A6L6WL65_9RHOB|nr:3'(2'),5'-bisphosphate nucleotidase CysQ [Zongyanglinia huanghaiensis]MVO16442.1 3'(2'),5'-bisphosphate nucleotidase CysQ [Zongyanglinia huanghaiensis]